MKDRGTANSPNIPVSKAGTVVTVVLGRIVPGGGWVLFGDRLVAEIWPVKRREKPDSKE